MAEAVLWPMPAMTQNSTLHEADHAAVMSHPAARPGVRAMIRLLRPRQWTKNLFVFAGAVFGSRALDPHWLAQALLAFAAFCGISSAVYVINDFFDRKSDRQHPMKRYRPLACGAVSPGAGLALACGAAVAAFALGALCGRPVVLLLAAYLVMMLAYTAWLKHRVIVDVMVIAAGFIMRIVAGTEAVQVPASSWIVLCTFFLALFLGFGKRRAEMNTLHHHAANTRSVLGFYSVPMLDRFCNISGTLAIATYALFTLSPGHNPTMLLTTPFVVLGLFRYLYLVEQRGDGEAPETILFRDRGIQFAAVGWSLLCVAILYYGLKLNFQ